MRGETADAGLTPDVRVSRYTGNPRPKVLLSRLTLLADSRERATVAHYAIRAVCRLRPDEGAAKHPPDRLAGLISGTGRARLEPTIYADQLQVKNVVA